jgi:hypothetical protein
MKEERIPKVFNVKVKHPRGRLRTRLKQQFRKDVTWKE